MSESKSKFGESICTLGSDISHARRATIRFSFLHWRDLRSSNSHLSIGRTCAILATSMKRPLNRGVTALSRTMKSCVTSITSSLYSVWSNVNVFRPQSISAEMLKKELHILRSAFSPETCGVVLDSAVAIMVRMISDAASAGCTSRRALKYKIEPGGGGCIRNRIEAIVY